MLLVTKIFKQDITDYRVEFLECLNHNLNLTEIKKIVVFTDLFDNKIPKHPKLVVRVKNNLNDFEIINFSKSDPSSKNIIYQIWNLKLSNDFHKITEEDLNNYVISIKNSLWIYKKDCQINNSSNIFNMFNRPIKNVNFHFNTIKLNLSNQTIREVNNNEVIIRKAEPSQKIEINKRDKKLDVIIISTNYNDYLLLSLSYNKKIFENITVVTSPDDLMCQEICKKFGVRCLRTDIMYQNGDKFNKGKAINFGINSIENPDLILLLDSDIIVTKEIDLSKLDDEALYTSSRWICKTYQKLEDWKENKNQFERVFQRDNDKGWGFFQLFNRNLKIVSNPNPFPETSQNAAMSDLMFRDKFTNRKSIEIDVIHLGDPSVNWNGRKTTRFIDDETFYNLFKKSNLNRSSENSNEWGVSNIKLGKSKYGKLKIDNQVQFSYHQGGWGEVLKSLKKVNSDDGIRFECFLEKNFCWRGSKGEVISEKWSGILHNPLNTPKWYLDKTGNTSIFESSNFINSLKNCLGLYVFSDYEKELSQMKLKNINPDVKVETLRHTIVECDEKWSIGDFKSNKRILHIGWWLRDIESFYSLKTEIPKIRIKLNYKIELQINKLFNLKNVDVVEIDGLDTYEYDSYLSNSVVFINLIDSVINNTVLECIERGTPILINRNKSIEEYIGKDYPLFYDDINNIDSLLTDENLLLASQYLIGIKKPKDIGTQIENSSIYQSIDTKLNIKTLFKPDERLFFGENIPNSEGGVYNPGFIKFNNKNYIILRVEKFTEKERGCNDLWKKTTSIPYLAEVDEKFNIIDISLINTIGIFKRIEDFRLFEFRGKLYSNHIILDEYGSIYPVISEIDVDNLELKILGKIELDIDLKKVEKNWTFYSINEKLYLIYSLSPWKIFEVNIENLTASQIINKNNNIKWSKEGYLSNSTNPIRVSENRNILGFHSRDNKLIYHQGFLTFDDEFNIVDYSKEPYLSGGDYDGINKNVIYTSSLRFQENSLFCLAGDGDFKSILIEIKDESLWKKLL